MILIHKGEIIKFTTDKLSAYVHAIEEHFSGKYAYLQIVKKRYKKILITVKKRFILKELCGLIYLITIILNFIKVLE